MSPLETLLTILGGIAALDFVAWRWGADSRDGRDWHARDDAISSGRPSCP